MKEGGEGTMSLLMNSWNFSIILALLVTGVSRHFGKASEAVRTASSNSSSVHSGTWETISWVA